MAAVLMYAKIVFSYQLESSGDLLLAAEEMYTICNIKEMLWFIQLYFARLAHACVLIQLWISE